VHLYYYSLDIFIKLKLCFMRKFALILSAVFFLGLQALTAQTKTISGEVIDDLGLGLPGVSVVVKGTTNGTVTRPDGAYSINVANDATTLVFTFVGMKTQEIAIAGQSVIDVTLVSDMENLDEVTVIGYGISMKANEKTGAWTKVKTDELEQLSFGSIDQAIQGRVPGMVFSSSGGNPTSENTVIIRGPGTIAGSMNPLYVIDGVPIGNGESVSDVATSFNPLSYLNPNDIASITVLKDAASTSIYGSRGANGVIVVTTKTGKGVDGVKFSFKAETSISDVAFDKREYMSSQEYSDWGDLALNNAGYDYDGWAYELGWDGETNTDWLDAVMRDAPIQQSYNLSALGSTDKSSYRISLGYTDQETLAEFTDYTKYNLSMDIRNQATEKLDIHATQNAAYQIVNGNTVSGSFSAPFFAGVLGLPIDAVYNEDGSYNTDDMSGYYDGWGNPLAQLDDNVNSTKVFSLNGSLGMGYQFMKDLSFDSNFSYNYQNYNEQLYWNADYGDGEDYNGYGYSSKANYFQFNWTNFLRYKKKFNDLHSISVDLGMDYQNTYRQKATMDGDNYSTDDPDLVYASESLSSSEYHENWALWGALLRTSYDYDSKYFAWGSIRRDYATIFAPDYREGYFWSAGLSWNVTREAFMENVSLINRLNLRANYGTSGDTPNTSFTSTEDYSPLVGSSVYGGEPSFEITSSGNDELTWQTTKTLNLGFDVDILDSRLSLSVDRYVKTTSDLILDKPIAYSNGGSNSIYSNVGEIQNRGWEFVLSGTPVKIGDFKMDLILTAAYNKSEVMSLIDGEDISVDGYKRLVVGEEVGSFYTRGWAGVNASDGTPQFYADGTKSEIVDDSGDADYYITGKAFPTWNGSVSTNMTYKGFSLNALFSFATDFSVYNVYNFIEQSDGEYLYANKLVEELNDSWTETNTDAKNPQQIYGGNNGSNDTSDRFLYDGDYIRLKELKLSYKLNKNTLNSIGFFNDVTFYARATNLWTHCFDEDLKVDPESNSSDDYTNFEGKGLYDNVSPVLRTFSLGLTVEF
jgi:TonB-linked SusC/RagA family outer membrane protein